MYRKKLVWQLFPSYLLITLAAIVGVTWYSIASLHQFYLEETAKQLEIRTRLLQDEFVPLMEADNLELVDDFRNRACSEKCRMLGQMIAPGQPAAAYPNVSTRENTGRSIEMPEE